MRRRSTLFALLVALGGVWAACGSAPKQEPILPPGDVDLPGVETKEFTPREKREFSDYVTAMPLPCASADSPATPPHAARVTLAQCVVENAPCASCRGAAQLIAKAVRDGLTHRQVEDLYKERFDVGSLKKIPLEGSPSRGPDAAPVVVVEFADFECPYCQKLAPELDDLWDRRKANVRFIFKFFPLPMHPHGEVAARAAIAAQMQGKFWEMHRKLFANGQRLDPSDLEGYAKAIGLDVDRFRVDMRSPTATERIEADRKLAEGLGIKGTPTIFIDGREYDSKMDLDDWIDSEINAASKH